MRRELPDLGRRNRPDHIRVAFVFDHFVEDLLLVRHGSVAAHRRKVLDRDAAAGEFFRGADLVDDLLREHGWNGRQQAGAGRVRALGELADAAPGPQRQLLLAEALVSRPVGAEVAQLDAHQHRDEHADDDEAAEDAERTDHERQLVGVHALRQELVAKVVDGDLLLFLVPVEQAEHREDEDGDDRHGQAAQEHHEDTVVLLTDAVVDPRAVMVVPLDALVAGGAVAGPRRPDSLALRAEVNRIDH